MNSISVSNKLNSLLPNLKLCGFVCNVVVQPSCDGLTGHINDSIAQLSAHLTPESIRNIDTVKANKDAYRKLGKDPNRYRPASESLLRRIASGKGLYFINNVVDILNLVSISTGYSICGYDFDAVSGDVVMDIGSEGEPYEGIGRGELNIESLPVFRDSVGAFGTPTSDSVRTQVGFQTRRFMMIIIGFGDACKMVAAADDAIGLLEKYADGSVIERFFIDKNN
jgi:DNA/RNA-binding domain of Phe-tRNA-synthetase-like protein